jgi:hypothetical protein
MADVLGIHGISQQQLGRNQLIAQWEIALRDGVAHARGVREPAPTLDVAFYGKFFLKTGKVKGLEDRGELDDDELAFFADIQDEVAPPGEPDDPTAATKGKGLPRPLGRLANALDKRFGVAGRLLFFGDLSQVRAYQSDDILAERVWSQVRDGLDRSSAQVMVGHSLGSIVAYEFLCVTPDHGVSTLVTIGSPLGMRSIRDRLRTEPRKRLPSLPPGVDRWVNVYDPSDPVALGGGLGPHWVEVTDRTVDNGDEPHAAIRYLGKEETGEPIATEMASP